MKMISGSLRRPKRRTNQEEGMSAADVALLRRLDNLCPEQHAMSERFQHEWELSAAPLEIELCDGECSEGDDWVKADPAGLQIVQAASTDSGAAVAAFAAASGIEQELQWYFQERDSRVLGSRRDPVSKPCARTVFARRLQRYAATSLRCGDRMQLAMWCDCLRCVVDARLFSSSNWLWPSRFERTLEACLVRLDGLRKLLEVQDQRQTLPVVRPVCPLEREAITKAVERREAPGSLSTAPLERLVLFRHVQRANKMLTDIRAHCPVIPGLQVLLQLNGWASSIILGTACLELTGQLVAEARAYATGEIDERTFAEDILVSSGSAAAFAVSRCVSAALCGSEHWAFMLADHLGPSCAALLMGILLRAVGRELNGGQKARALKNAYASLGLSPAGADKYTAAEIEAQLKYGLTKTVPTDRELLRYWAAYAYIREHQHPELADPWQHLSASPAVGAPLLDRRAACHELHLNPEVPHTAVELRRRYLQLSLVHHPDKPTGSHQSYLRLHGAYEHLLRACCQDD